MRPETAEYVLPASMWEHKKIIMTCCLKALDLQWNSCIIMYW
jgi:hypothetical protein